MNNKIKTIKEGILLITVLGSLTVSAYNSNTSIINDEIKTTAFTLNDVKKGDVLLIKDSEGIVLYKELIKASGVYKKGFNFSSLPNGDYFFEIEKDLVINTIPFAINNSIVLFKNETSSFKPFLKLKNNLVYLSKLTPNLEAVTINIYANNEGNELLHSEIIEGLQTIDRVYKLEKGNYKIIISSNNKEYTEFINN